MSNGKAAAKASRVGVIRALGILASLLALSRAQILRAQDVPLDSCRALATIEATASQRRLRFLLDTGATSSLLNAKSFPAGDSTRVVMHSWNGASSANGREAGISDLARHFVWQGGIKAAAIDTKRNSHNADTTN
jgi:hypothetical protein